MWLSRSHLSSDAGNVSTVATTHSDLTSVAARLDRWDLDDTGAQDAYCTGYKPYNGFYGHGLVDAVAAVTGDTATGQAVTEE